MRTRNLILIIGGFLGVYFYKQYQKAKQFMISINKVKTDFNSLINYNYEKLPLKITLKLVNPTDVIFKINSFNVKIYYKGVLMGTTFTTQTINIKPKETTFTTIDFLIDIINLSSNFRDLVKVFLEGSGTEIYLKGFIDSNFGRIQINENYKF